LKEAAAFSQTPAGTDNPGLSRGSMVGGGSRKMRKSRFSAKRRKSHRKMRGGAILNGEGAPSNASYMLLADDAALAKAAAQVENPAWEGVAKMQFV
jgi:hypothetical protein